MTRPHGAEHTFCLHVSRQSAGGGDGGAAGDGGDGDGDAVFSSVGQSP